LDAIDNDARNLFDARGSDHFVERGCRESSTVFGFHTQLPNV